MLPVFLETEGQRRLSNQPICEPFSANTIHAGASPSHRGRRTTVPLPKSPPDFEKRISLSTTRSALAQRVAPTRNQRSLPRSNHPIVSATRRKNMRRIGEREEECLSRKK